MPPTIRSPLSALPEMTLPAPAAVPPIVLPVAVDDVDAVVAVARRHGAGGVGADQVALDEVVAR